MGRWPSVDEAELEEEGEKGDGDEDRKECRSIRFAIYIAP